jgi:hypothetical protein
MFLHPGEDSNWLMMNVRPGDQRMCYVLGAMIYFPSA